MIDQAAINLITETHSICFLLRSTPMSASKGSETIACTHSVYIYFMEKKQGGFVFMYRVINGHMRRSGGCHLCLRVTCAHSPLLRWLWSLDFLESQISYIAAARTPEKCTREFFSFEVRCVVRSARSNKRSLVRGCQLKYWVCDCKKLRSERIAWFVNEKLTPAVYLYSL